MSKNSKESTASYEPYKRLLPVVLLPFARDATSAYKLNTSYVVHIVRKTDTIDMSPTTAVNALYSSAITFRRAYHAVKTNSSASACHDYDNSYTIVTAVLSLYNYLG